jgi:hypothetical protein
MGFTYLGKALSQRQLSSQFGLPLLTEAFNQLQDAASLRDHFPLTDQHDSWQSI